MELLATLLICTLFWKSSSSLECYECQPGNEVVQAPCRDFKETDSYKKHCLNSTICYKRVTTMDFNGYKTAQTVERGCAMQTLDQDQRRINGHWRLVHTIYEVYEEGCHEDTHSERSTKILNCYCRGDYCNTAVVNKGVIGLLVTALVLAIR